MAASARSAAARPPAPPRATLREDWRAFTWRSPDWWLGAASLAAWVALTWMFLAMAWGATPAGHGAHDPHSGHAVHAAPASTWAMPYGALLGSWALMAVAMMVPLARKRARWLAFRSLRARRQHAVATFAAGFLAVWLAAGAIAIALAEPVRGEPWAVAGALALAAWWQRAPARRRLLRRCGVLRAPAVHGARAPADWAHGGLLIGARCVATCGALMLPMAIVHHPALMLGAALVVTSERRRGPNPETRGGRRREAVWIAAAAGAVAGIAVAA